MASHKPWPAGSGLNRLCADGFAPGSPPVLRWAACGRTAGHDPYPIELARVCNLASLDQHALNAVLAATDVGEVWGVGRRIAAQLKEGGVHTVLDLSRLDLGTVRQHWSVVLERTVRELQGQACTALEDVAPDKQEIACTRSFGQPVTALSDLREAISEFASRAAEKLRRQSAHARQVLVFVRTSPFRSDPQYSRSIVIPLRRPTADTTQLVEAAVAGLVCIYRPDFLYAKAGVMLLDLQPDSVQQGELSLEPEPAGRGADKGELMGALDFLNRRYGRGTVLVASSGLGGDSWCCGLEGTVTQHAPSSLNLSHARHRKYDQVSYAGLACKLNRTERSSEQRKFGG